MPTRMTPSICERLRELGPVMAVANSGMRLVGVGATAHEARCNPLIQPVSDDYDEDALIDFIAWALNNRATIESQAARIEALEEVVAHRGMALAPFAEACSNCIDETDRDEDRVWEHPIGMELTFRDFREAHQVLTTLAGRETP